MSHIRLTIAYVVRGGKLVLFHYQSMLFHQPSTYNQQYISILYIEYLKYVCVVLLYLYLVSSVLRDRGRTHGCVLGVEELHVNLMFFATKFKYMCYRMYKHVMNLLITLLQYQRRIIDFKPTNSSAYKIKLQTEKLFSFFFCAIELS